MKPWGLGKVIQKAGAAPVIALQNLRTATDQLIVPPPQSIVVPKIFEILKNEARETLDPSMFSAETATLCGLCSRRDWTGNYLPSTLVFITVKAMPD